MFYQRKLDEIMSAEPSVVTVCGKKRSIGWMRNYAERRLTRLMLKEVDDDAYALSKRNVQAMSLMLLMRKWKIVFFHWIYWRWLFYVSEVTPVEVLGVLEAVKKKMTTEPSMMCTTSLIGMMDVMMTMTREEARLTRAVPRGVRPTA